MWARLTIDHDFVIRAIEVRTVGMPYPGACDRIEPAYGKLVGASLVQGFRKRLHDDMGGVHGCTHVTELLGSLPTAAVQTFAGLRRENEGDAKAVPARPLPRARNDDRYRAPLLSEMVSRHSNRGQRRLSRDPEFARCIPAAESRLGPRQGVTREDPRVPGQGDLSQVRHGHPARHPGVLGR
jgi:hypothetical protein